jgi:hypothetical protein
VCFSETKKNFKTKMNTCTVELSRESFAGDEGDGERDAEGKRDGEGKVGTTVEEEENEELEEGGPTT